MGGLNSKWSQAGKSLRTLLQWLGFPAWRQTSRAGRVWKSCLGAPRRAGAGASISDSPAGGSQRAWDGLVSSGVLCCYPGGTNMVRQVRHFSIPRNFSFQKFQQN